MAITDTINHVSTTNGGDPDDVAISVTDLWKVFGDDPDRALEDENSDLAKRDFQEDLGLVVALQNVTFDVHHGETFVVMGLSGSGKSTLIRCLLRLIEPTAGSIVVEEEDITEANRQRLIEFRRGKIAMVFQHYGLLPHRTVIENASWGLELRGVEKEERYSKVRETLDLVGLDGWEDSYPRELSGGMQQRVGLARALAMDPEILLMDEPFSGLDPLIRRNMQDELLRLQQDLHKTIIFITHDLAEAVRLGDRIAIMRDGAIVQIGEPEDIVLRPQDAYVAEFTQDVRRESILTARHVMVKPSAVIASGAGPDEALRAIQGSDQDVAMVLGGDQTYLGFLTEARAETAIQAGADELGDDADRYLHTYPEPVTPDITLDELIPISMTCDYPVPVVNEAGKLLGVVDRRTLAETITTED